MKTPKDQMHEWTDPVTGVKHRCPRRFMYVLAWLQYGKRNAKLADDLLTFMGEGCTPENRRHLRQATMILRGEGNFVVSERSSRGGYFIAESYAELKEFLDMQLALAHSMIAKVDRLWAAWHDRRAA